MRPSGTARGVMVRIEREGELIRLPLTARTLKLNSAPSASPVRRRVEEKLVNVWIISLEEESK
jgi:ribosomal protein L28